MNYYFGFNLGVKLYKNFPTLKIYADDRLVDLIHLDESNLYKDHNIFDRKTYPAGSDGDRYWHLDRLVSDKVHLFEISDKYLNREITIDIDNSDSNYTNGFMTNSTLIYFSNIFLIPASLHTTIADIVAKYETGENDEKDHTEQSKSISYWPMTKKYIRTFLGGNTVLKFPVRQDMKYKHFDNEYHKGHTYYSTAKAQFGKSGHDAKYINFCIRYLRMIDQVINK